jgi:hypothetical protein
MATIKGRGRRAGLSTVRVNAHVTPEAKAKAESIADVLGISMSAYLEDLIRQEQLDERGRPVRPIRPVPRDQGELPLKTA